jgi:GR25 family glycosyltransferase involved in LPS biosynthesis
MCIHNFVFIYISLFIYREYSIYVFLYLFIGSIPYITQWPLSLLYKSNHDDPANIYCTPNNKIIVTEIIKYYQTNFSSLIPTINYNPKKNYTKNMQQIDWVIEENLESVLTRTYPNFNEFTPVDIIPLNEDISDSNVRKYKPSKVKDDNARTIYTGTIDNASTDNARTVNPINDSNLTSKNKKYLKIENLKTELRKRNRKNKNKNK